MLGTYSEVQRFSPNLFKSFYVWLDRHILCGYFTIRPFLGFFPYIKVPTNPLIFAPRVHSKNSKSWCEFWYYLHFFKQDAHFQKSCLHILNCQWMVKLSWNKHKSLERKKNSFVFSKKYTNHLFRCWIYLWC